MKDKKTPGVFKSLDKIQTKVIDQLARKNSYLEKILDVSRKISTLDLMSCLYLIMENIVKITQAQRGFLMLFDESKNLQVRVAVGLDEELLNEGQQFEISRSIARDVANLGKSELIENIRDNARYKNARSVVELQLRAVICLPLKTKEEIIGVIYVDSDRSAHRFHKSELEIFEAFASQAAVTIDNARLYEKLKKKNIKLQQEVQGYYQFGEIICESEKMKNVLQMVSRVLDNSISVLIEGETGTGKELIAHAIHYNSLHKENPLVIQNCGALSETLLESELFGHKKGAFTGAVENRMGLFEAANGGTIFLDEIGEISLDVQMRLLRVLENGTIRRVGETMDRKIDVRVIAATNRDLKEEVKNGRFREDLYYRLNVFPIHIPPLRERKEDILILVQHFVRRYNEELGKQITSISPEFNEWLFHREWRGNVRELKNLIYRTMVLTNVQELTLQNLPPQIDKAKITTAMLSAQEDDIPIRPLKEIEMEYIQYALNMMGGNQSETARQLGLKRSALAMKLKRWKEQDGL